MGRSAPIDICLPSALRRRPIFARAPGVGVRASADSVDVFGEIGWDVTPTSIKSALAGKGNVHLQINSPGGSAFDGIAIYNLLVAHPGEIAATVIGVAASAASIVAMGASDLRMAKGSHLMIHNSWGLSVGNAATHDETAALLRKVDTALGGIYSDRTGKSAGDIAALMNAETWLDADSAVERGFADAVTGSDAKNIFDLSVYANAPTSIARRDGRDEVSDAADIERMLRAAGVRSGAAKKIANAGWTALHETVPATNPRLMERLKAAKAELAALRS